MAPARAIPLVDLRAQYASIQEEVRTAIDDVLEGMQLTIGPNVRSFDEEFARFCGTKHSIGVGSGTDALQLVLRALGVSAGDEVITVSHTFFATVEAILYSGARPVLVDVRESDFLMDADAVAAAITSRTRAILPVHLYGRTVDMRPYLDLAKRHGIAVVEDACQAHGATLDTGGPAGGAGRAAAFSFYCSKNLGAYGEAGAITTDDDQLARDLRSLREHGQSTRYYHPVVGYNARLDEIQAAVLRVKLRKLSEWNERRRTIARLYDGLLQGSDVILPEIPAGGRHVFHLYVVRVPSERRDAFREHLTQRGIGTGVHYPVPVHLQEAAQFLGYARGDLPVTERLAAEVVSLPMYPELRDSDVETVAEAVKEFFRG
ncbi:MAG TPA: DegT/DnrJ/EryC1/StrS family aminotransferase [Candidatus Limnocylindria bacterium]